MAYAFLVQCFENVTIVAHVSLRIKTQIHLMTGHQFPS